MQSVTNLKVSVGSQCDLSLDGLLHLADLLGFDAALASAPVLPAAAADGKPVVSLLNADACEFFPDATISAALEAPLQSYDPKDAAHEPGTALLEAPSTEIACPRLEKLEREVSTVQKQLSEDMMEVHALFKDSAATWGDRFEGAEGDIATLVKGLSGVDKAVALLTARQEDVKKYFEQFRAETAQLVSDVDKRLAKKLMETSSEIARLRAAHDALHQEAKAQMHLDFANADADFAAEVKRREEATEAGGIAMTPTQVSGFEDEAPADSGFVGATTPYFAEVGDEVEVYGLLMTGLNGVCGTVRAVDDDRARVWCGPDLEWKRIKFANLKLLYRPPTCG